MRVVNFAGRANVKQTVEFVLSCWNSVKNTKPVPRQRNVLTPENLHLYELESRVLYSAAPFATQSKSSENF